MNEDRFEFAYSPTDLIGGYRPGVSRTGRLTAMLVCPDCAMFIPLDDKKYRIDESGSVTPEVFCYSVGCDFAAHVTLRDWAIHARG